MAADVFNIDQQFFVLKRKELIQKKKNNGLAWGCFTHHNNCFFCDAVKNAKIALILFVSGNFCGLFGAQKKTELLD